MLSWHAIIAAIFAMGCDMYVNMSTIHVIDCNNIKQHFACNNKIKFDVMVMFNEASLPVVPH